MSILSNLTQHIARSPGDPKVLRKGPSSLTAGDTLARWLGIFSFALGFAELITPGRITRAIGLDGKESLVRAFGAREISAGIPTVSIDKHVGLMMRIAGDGLDIATVAPALRSSNPQRGNAAMVFGALFVITALDVIAAAMTGTAHKRVAPPRDYSDRSGFPRGLEATRGLARRDFATPPDYRAPGTNAEPMPMQHAVSSGQTETQSA
jgi:hypothetical protein